MVFLVREHIFLIFFFWPLGVFGDVIEPFVQNQAVVAGTGNAAFTCSSTPETPEIISWYSLPVGSLLIAIGPCSHLLITADFDLLIDDKKCVLKVKIASVSRAGVYYCRLQSQRFAQLIVVTEEPTCKYTTNEKTPCDKISEMSCTVRYAANDSYVVPNMIWSAVGSSSKSLDSSIKTSTSANIITAISTLKLTKPENKESLSKFRCTMSFNLKDNLPSGFATNRPDYNKECVPNPDACTDEKPGNKPTLSKSGDNTALSLNARDTTKASAKTGNNSTTSGGAANIKNPSGEGPDAKSKGDGNSGDSAGNSASGFSVGSSQRYIGILCVVGIVGFFLVDV